MWLPYPIGMIGAGSSVLSILDVGSTSNVSGSTLFGAIGFTFPSGSTVVAWYSSSSSSIHALDVSDDANAYVQIGSDLTQGFITSSMWYCENAVGQTNGSMFVTLDNTGTTGNQTINVMAITGTPTSGVLDNFGTGIGTSAAPSASITTTNAKTVLVAGVAGNLNVGQVYTQSSGYTTPYTKAGNTITNAGGSKTLIASGSDTYTGGLGISANWTCMLAGFKYN